MKNIIMILLFASICSAATSGTLDSIYKESKVGEQKARHIGWFPTKGVGVTPEALPVAPSKAITKEKSMEFLPEKSMHPVQVAPSVTIKKEKILTRATSQDTLINELVQKIDSLGSKVSDLESNQEKITLIEASLQTQSLTHSDSMSLITNLLGIVIGAIATLLAAYITAKATKKI
jgi:hypothetical protein